MEEGQPITQHLSKKVEEVIVNAQNGWLLRVKQNASGNWKKMAQGGGAYLSQWCINQEQVNNRNDRVLHASSGPRFRNPKW